MWGQFPRIVAVFGSASRLPITLRMFEQSVPISSASPGYPLYTGDRLASLGPPLPHTTAEPASGILDGLRRRWLRERRRRKVGRAYDMAMEIARVLPRDARVLDVGCGNGFIAHHLSALLGQAVLGIDLEYGTEAPINYRCFDGNQFPVESQSVDAVLLCYVLHHAQNLESTLMELRRVLVEGGIAVVFEDVPERWWDRLVCLIHDRQWRNRTGPCTFRDAREWRTVFNDAGFEVMQERQLSRWRNLAHPVSRRFYALRARDEVNRHMRPI
ncbi:MAG: class I SAM-dependent methyltransferase [Acidobacteriota bacterium]|nr:class I SAM-dependent methyltransferase [Acidobacteriota bacterium]